MEQFSDENKKLILLQSFIERLNKEPDPKELEPTPDGKAQTLPISFVQMTLDELYFGLWESSDPVYMQIFNEVVATVVLTVTHPVTGEKLKRTGWASVVITQDKDALVSNFNNTKKKNALDLAFPKLGAEALKSAAQSLGKVFGRDINRKLKDTFKKQLRPITDALLHAAIKRIENGEIETLLLVEKAYILTEDQRALLEGTQPLKQLA